MMKKIFVISILLFQILCINSLIAQSITAETVAKFRDELYREGFETIMEKSDIDANIAFAVILPEVIRYNALKDKIEIASLKTLYVQFGERYSNFSVGRFQMKPSFAEGLERRLLESGIRRFMSIIADTVDCTYARKRRVERLSSLKGQMHYLALFMVVVQCRFPEISDMSKIERLRFYATAYNFDYMADKQKIISRQNQKEYHTDLFRTVATICYNYSDISVLCYTYLE